MNAVRMGLITAMRTQHALIAKEVSLVRAILVSMGMALGVQVICFLEIVFPSNFQTKIP